MADHSKPRLATWARAFLATLADTSNVTAAAKAAGIHKSTAYDARRSNADFNRKWQQALCEGYDHLEMELLHRLRAGEVKASSAKRGVRQFDNAAALRLLAAHRDSAAQQRALRSSQDRRQILIAIDAKLDMMRTRRLAAARTISAGTIPEGDGDGGE